MMKRGQLLGQPFMYIFIIVVSVLILVFGVRYVIQLKETAGDITTNAFIKDIEKKFSTVYTDSVGSSVTLKDIKVPTTMKEICFVDYLETFDLSNVKDAKLRELINGTSRKEDPEENLFLAGDSEFAHELNFNIDLDSEFVICDSLEDYEIDIKLTNEGQTIKAELI